MTPSAFRSLSIGLFAVCAFSACDISREGLLVRTHSEADTYAVMKAADSTAKQWRLRKIYYDDMATPQILCAYGRWDGMRILVTREDSDHVFVGTNPYHQDDRDHTRQIVLRASVEARLREIFPKKSVRMETYYPPAKWVEEGH